MQTRHLYNCQAGLFRKIEFCFVFSHRSIWNSVRFHVSPVVVCSFDNRNNGTALAQCRFGIIDSGGDKIDHFNLRKLTIRDSLTNSFYAKRTRFFAIWASLFRFESWNRWKILCHRNDIFPRVFHGTHVVKPPSQKQDYPTNSFSLIECVSYPTKLWQRTKML